MKAMIFAAGLGTRLKPFTLNAPKAMAPINGKPLIQKNIEFLKQFGITELVVNVHHFANQITDFLHQHQNFGCTIHISDETDQLLETGGGLLKAKQWLEDDSFLVMNVDILTNLNIQQLINYHKKNKALATLAVSQRNSSRQLLFTENNQLCGWRNLTTNQEITTKTPATQALAFSGIHIIEPAIFKLFSHSGKFSIIDTYLDLMHSQNIVGYNHSGDILLDVGKPESLEKAAAIFK